MSCEALQGSIPGMILTGMLRLDLVACTALDARERVACHSTSTSLPNFETCEASGQTGPVLNCCQLLMVLRAPWPPLAHDKNEHEMLRARCPSGAAVMGPIPPGQMPADHTLHSGSPDSVTFGLSI